jgi:penicillin-binding protein activator
MTMMRFSLLSGGLFAFLLTACAGTIDRRVDPDAPDSVGGAVLQSQDIRTMADRMSRDIASSGVLTSAPQGERVSFHITSLRNDSGDPIDKEIVLTKLRTELQRAMGRNIRVLDRSAEGLEAVQAERAAKRNGSVDSRQSARGNVAGSDYALKGTIKSRVQQSGSLKSVYYLVTFELTDLETSEIAWSGDYETKFESEKSVISR